jgi:type I restriction enzyme S subunit
MKENIPVPDMEVQEKVARAVHTRKALFKEIAKAIDLLQERRTALISAAVTGQIDVRQT